MDMSTAGQTLRQVRLSWAITLDDGSCFTDPKWVTLLEHFRRFVWSLYVNPYFGKGLKETSLGRVHSGIKPLILWMARNQIEDFSKLNRRACEKYIEDTVDELSSGEDGEDNLTFSTLWQRFKTIAWLHQQSPALITFGVPSVPETPFDEDSASEIAKKYITQKLKRIPPLPDEVALPLMSSAYRLIGTPADDIIRLQAEAMAAFAEGIIGAKKGRGDSASSRGIAAFRAATAFRFSILEGETEPWNKPLSIYRSKTHAQDDARITPIQELRNLIIDIRDAAIITLQSQTGMRINEVCSIISGIDIGSGLPRCVDVRKSISGLHEIFYLKGWLAKTVTTNTETEWIIGLRPVGSGYLPPTVRAIQVLQDLMAPWRSLGETEKLIVSFSHPRGIPHIKSSIGPATNLVLLAGLKRFAYRHGTLSNLPDRSTLGEDLRPYRETQGDCITTHQWRKTWALYMFRSDRRMLPAISQQFKHLSLAMTEQGYIGNDSRLIEALDSARSQRTASFFYAAATGKVMVGGGMASTFEKYRSEILTVIDKDSPQDMQPRLEGWIMENDLRIFFTEYGKCLIGVNPVESRCQRVAGSAKWDNPKPNFSTREPSLCLGCSCFAVDPEHADFWRRREKNYRAIYMEAEKAGRHDEIPVAKARANQATQVLSVITKLEEQ